MRNAGVNIVRLMTMFKLINKTQWNTKDLRILCNAVIKHTGSHKQHQIIIQTRKGRYSQEDYGGRASIGGSWIVIKVPKTFKNVTKPIYSQTEKTIGSDGNEYSKIERFEHIREPLLFNTIEFAQVLEHEIGHNLGLSNHRDMAICWKRNADYCKDMIINKKELKEKQKKDLRETRFEKVRNKITELQRKIKRYSNLLKKYQKKYNYYQKSIHSSS